MANKNKNKGGGGRRSKKKSLALWGAGGLIAYELLLKPKPGLSGDSVAERVVKGSQGTVVSRAQSVAPVVKGEAKANLGEYAILLIGAAAAHKFKNKPVVGIVGKPLNRGVKAVLGKSWEI